MNIWHRLIRNQVEKWIADGEITQEQMVELVEGIDISENPMFMENTINASGNVQYKSLSGYTMERDKNGPSEGHWVLRDPDGNVIGEDAFRHDLAERFEIKLGTATKF